MQNELLVKTQPSFNDVFFWRDLNITKEQIIPKVRAYIESFNEDPDSFLEDEALFCTRAINLLSFHKIDDLFYEIFHFVSDLEHEDDEELLSAGEEYLNNTVSSQHESFLVEQYEKVRTKGIFEETMTVVDLLMRVGHYSKELDDDLAQLMLTDDPEREMPKSFFCSCLHPFPKAQQALKKRLRFITPMVKYGPKDIMDNAYFGEWVEMRDPYLEYFHNYKKEYPGLSIDKSNDEKLLYAVLGIDDPRIEKIHLEKIKNLKTSGHERQMTKLNEEVQQMLEREFFPLYPENFEDWIDSDFTDPRQRSALRELMEYLVDKYEVVTKVGRNEKCPCGSGKKYKKCCLT